MTTSNPSSTTSSPDLPAGLAPRRRGWLDGSWVTMRTAGLTLLRGRRGITLALVCALPLAYVLIGFLRGGVGPKGALGFVETITTFYFRGVNLLVCLFVGCSALGEEIEGRTLPYLLIRPLPRGGLLLGRWLTGFVSAGLLLGTSYVVVYAATVGQMGTAALWVDGGVLGFALLALALSVAAYTAFFVLLSVVVKWPLLLGLGLLFVWEAWATELPGTAARYTLLHHVYVLLARWSGEESYLALASPFGDPLLTAGESLQVLAWFIVITLGLALLRFRRRAYLV